ncbi:MAG TPA: sigma 54 modulation/S30EA ribosomal C-terminal domain-containing protein [Pseudonocardiaceae bacterium]|jgi:hypothetical protein|nr:sigma 54 modulation/S30EA ribosomal C-terminal domain-containing protein [Pseudonocardiaceae bacterium]
MTGRVARGDILVHTAGEVLGSAREYVRRQVAGFVRRVPEQVASVRVRLTANTKPTMPWPALAQANLTVAGCPVRAQVVAGFFHEAAGLLRRRLAEQVARVGDPDRLRPWPDPTRPTAPDPAPRPAGQRRIARHKQYEPACCTVAQAALTMDLMDYDFHLFVDARTGQDSVLYRVGPTGYRLAGLRTLPPPPAPDGLPLAIDVHPVPNLPPAEVVPRLDETGLAFRFFRNAETGRGAVLYRRYDGHYGLLEPT